MELALYCPDYGYYEAEADKVGKRGDFFTSVSVGSVFGELLAFRFAQWLSSLSTGTRDLCLVEAGAHTGQLARDILTSLRESRRDLYETMTYRIVEPSPRRARWQEETLREFSGRVQWSRDLTELARHGRITGVIFSNELLDAMPVQRLGWDARRRTWFEWGVAFENGALTWKRMPDESADLQEVPVLSASILDDLPDGFVIDSSPSAVKWWREAANSLGRGRLVAFDYGMSLEEMLLPHRAEGTLRAYGAHAQRLDVLARPGEQDITAHVNFTAIEKAGLAAGLQTDTLTSQESFLSSIVRDAEVDPGGFPLWTPARVRQFQTLVHPEHLGRKFRVLVQSR